MDTTTDEAILRLQLRTFETSLTALADRVAQLENARPQGTPKEESGVAGAPGPVESAALRTRAEVDAEIGDLIRQSVSRHTRPEDCLCPEPEDIDRTPHGVKAERVRGLCREPTREPEPATEAVRMTDRPLVQNAKNVLEDLYNSTQLAGHDEVSKHLRTRIDVWFRAFEVHVRAERLGPARQQRIAKLMNEIEPIEAESPEVDGPCGCEETQRLRAHCSYALKHLEVGHVLDGTRLLREALK